MDEVSWSTFQNTPYLKFEHARFFSYTRWTSFRMRLRRPRVRSLRSPISYCVPQAAARAATELLPRPPDSGDGRNRTARKTDLQPCGGAVSAPEVQIALIWYHSTKVQATTNFARGGQLRPEISNINHNRTSQRYLRPWSRKAEGLQSQGCFAFFRTSRRVWGPLSSRANDAGDA